MQSVEDIHARREASHADRVVANDAEAQAWIEQHLPPNLVDLSDEDSDSDIDFDEVEHDNCPKVPSSARATRLTRTVLAQVVLRYLYGMTRRNMQGLATILQWKDDDGSNAFNIDEMVSHKTLGKVIDQLPLLKTYVKKVVTIVKGKKSTALMASHSLDDVTRRLLQMVPLDLMVFHAKNGHTRYVLIPLHSTPHHYPPLCVVFPLHSTPLHSTPLHSRTRLMC